MFPLHILLAICLVLSVLDARPLRRRDGHRASLGIAARMGERGILGIADRDRARVRAMNQVGRLGKRDGSISTANMGVSYTAQVGVGQPPTYYTLLIDTGSANTWVGANKPYVPTSASQDTGNSVTASYSAGNFTGEEWVDTVTLAPGLVIENQSIGVANTSGGFTPGIDGILGLGPVALTNGSVQNTGTVPTVMDNLYQDGVISEEVLGVYFVPSSEAVTNGTLTFGGCDDSVITGPVQYVPLTTTMPASYFWGIDQSASYGNETILSTTAGIVDTGTSLILLPTDAFEMYQNATGGVLDNATGLLTITPTQYANLQPLSFHIGSATYDLTPNAQIWPRALNTQIGGNASAIYLVVNAIDSQESAYFAFVNGFTFLQRFYSVFDTTHGRVGFAPTAYTASTSN